jgi:hypothetical protein|tara:strand:+ start:260 stop:397 length:138 start_codon:yes stop_codon:yes gene_type:complete
MRPNQDIIGNGIADKEKRKKENFVLMQDQDFFADKTASRRYQTNT